MANNSITELMETSVWGYAVFAALLGVQIVPIWWLDFFPTVDGPVHIYNADLILKMLSGEWQVHEYFFEFNTQLDPNWFLHLILAAIVHVSDAVIAEKLLLTFYFLLLAGGFLYAIRSINPQASHIAILSVPFYSSFIFHFGFFSFTFSLAVSLFVFGFWFRYHQQLNIRRGLVMALLLVMLYLFHVVSYIATMLALGVLALADAIITLTAEKNTRLDFGTVFRRLFKYFLPLAIIAIPSLILFSIFFFGREVVIEPSHGPITRAAHLLLLTQLISFDHKEVFFSALAGLVIFGTLLYHLVLKIRQRNFVYPDILLLAFAAVFLLYLFTPDTLVTSPGGIPGGGLMQLRLSYIPMFLLLLWLSTLILPRIHKALISTLGIVITLGMFGFHWFSYARTDALVAEYLSAADYIEKGAVVLPLRMGLVRANHAGKDISQRFDIFTHAGNRLALQRDAVNLQNLEAMVGYFPVRFRDGLSPYHTMGRLDIDNPQINIRAYETVSRHQIDYISLWGEKDSTDAEGSQRIHKALEQDYKKIFISSNKYLELFKRVPR